MDQGVGQVLCGLAMKVCLNPEDLNLTTGMKSIVLTEIESS